MRSLHQDNSAKAAVIALAPEFVIAPGYGMIINTAFEISLPAAAFVIV